MMSLIRIIHAVYKKNRITIKRAYPLSFMLQRISTAFFLVIPSLFSYYFTFNKSVSKSFLKTTGVNDYVSYILLGQSMYIICLSILSSVGRSMITEIREGTIGTLFLSPCSRLGYFLGFYFEQLGRSFAELIFIIGSGYCFGARINLSTLHLWLFFVFLTSLVCFCVSILISSIMVMTRDTFITQNTIFVIISFSCGILFPISYLPDSIQLISALIPLSYVLYAFRKCVLIGETVYSNLYYIITAIILAIGYLIIGFICIRVIEKRIIENEYS